MGSFAELSSVGSPSMLMHTEAVFSSGRTSRLMSWLNIMLRLLSVCGQMGARTMAFVAGCMIGPPAERL